VSAENSNKGAPVFKEFKAFIMKGNVVDLAVAVVIGAAFSAIVTSIVSGLMTPLVALAGDKDFDQLFFTINKTKFLYGPVISAIISFVSIAAVVFFLIVKPMNALQARRNRGEAPADPTTRECPECLSEIPIKASRCAHCTAKVPVG
jgi:large conductance mechanosensitive channel